MNNRQSYVLHFTLLVLASSIGCAQKAEPPPAERMPMPKSISCPPSQEFYRRIAMDLVLLKKLLDANDVGMATIVREQLKERISPTDTAFASELAQSDQRLAQQTLEQEVRVTDEYVLVTRPFASLRWKAALVTADEILEQQRRLPKHTGVLVARIRKEDTKREGPLGVRCHDVNNFSCCWGYGGHEYVNDVEPLFLGAPHQLGPKFGEIEIEALAHRCPRVEVELPEDGVQLFGELIVLAVPPNECGQLRIHVEAEAGLPLQQAAVHVGRRHAGWKMGKPLQSDNTCTFEQLAPGGFDAYVTSQNRFSSAHVKGQILQGQTTEVTLHAYACREILFEWRYRRKAGEGEWHSGTSTVLTGDSAPLDTWEINGSVYQLSVWDKDGARISGMNGRVMIVDGGLFESDSPVLPIEEIQRSRRSESPLEVGKVYGLTYGRGEDVGEALLRVKSITPVTQRITK